MLAALLQFIPQIGAVLGLIGPVLTAWIRWQDWEHPLYVLILYAVIVVVDGDDLVGFLWIIIVERSWR